jgi:hypothetical protein
MPEVVLCPLELRALAMDAPRWSLLSVEEAMT